MLASIGPTLDALSDQSGSTISEISVLFTANAVGFVAGSMLAWRLYRGVRGNLVIAGALGAMAVFTATIPLLDTLWLLIGAFAGIGLSIGTIGVGSNTLLMWLFGDVQKFL